MAPSALRGVRYPAPHTAHKKRPPRVQRAEAANLVEGFLPAGLGGLSRKQEFDFWRPLRSKIADDPPQIRCVTSKAASIGGPRLCQAGFRHEVHLLRFGHSEGAALTWFGGPADVVRQRRTSGHPITRRPQCGDNDIRQRDSRATSF
jgi:hypothetical protein